MKKFLLAAALVGLVAAGCNKSVGNNNQNQDQNQNSSSLDAQNSNNSLNASANQQAQSSQSTTQTQNSAQNSNPASSGLHYSDGSDAEAPTPDVVGVDITSTGFSPATVTIKQGDYVQFTNRDTQPHLPASNPHPTHTDYPGFQAPAALQTGQIYRFQFTKVGSWGYHDHLNPSLGGTIVVQPLQ